MKKIFGTLFILLLAVGASSQDNRLIEINNAAYHYISLLQHHGYLGSLNPTSLPYTEREVDEGLRNINEENLTHNEKEWVGLLKRILNINDEVEAGDFSYGFTINAEGYAGNSRRKNTVRPLGNDVFTYPSVSFSGYLEKDDLVANLSFKHDLYYDRDPDGLDAGNRLYIRSENAYLGYNGDWFKVYFGRFKNHWAPYGETSSILSANPNSFDQLNVRFGNDKLSLRSVVGELDNISANDNFTGRAFREGSKRRYIAAHRFDWRPMQHFRIAFFESVIYSGVNTGVSLKYFNPLHTFTFVTDNSPKNDENNLLIGGMLWFQWNGFTFNSQLMLDDFQVKDNAEKNTFTYTASLYKAKFFRNVDLGLEFEAVSYQSYNPEQPEGRYLYLQRGLATQFNDYILGSAYLNVYPSGWIRGLSITPKIQILLQGEQTINQPLVKTYPDGSPFPYALTGNEEQTLRPSLSFRFQKKSFFWVEGDLGINFVQNFNNQPNIQKTRFSGSIKLGFDLGFFGSD